MHFSEFISIFFTRKRTKHENTRKSAIFVCRQRLLGAQSINTETASLRPRITSGRRGLHTCKWYDQTLTRLPDSSTCFSIASTNHVTTFKYSYDYCCPCDSVSSILLAASLNISYGIKRKASEAAAEARSDVQFDHVLFHQCKRVADWLWLCVESSDPNIVGNIH